VKGKTAEGEGANKDMNYEKVCKFEAYGDFIPENRSLGLILNSCGCPYLSVHNCNKRLADVINVGLVN